jgi:hypothetical protein
MGKSRMPRDRRLVPFATAWFHPLDDYPTLGSLSDLKELGCKSVWTVHISPLFDQQNNYWPSKSSKSFLARSLFCIDSSSPAGLLRH